MKNLSTIPRLSLSETFTILITLVVCLAGFTEAEVLSHYRKEGPNQQEENYLLKEASFKENAPYFRPTENEEKNVAKFKIIPEPPLGRLIKRHSDEFGQSEESDERESDGYGYDDDEYYHFNFKRNDDALDNKMEKEGVHDVNNNKEGQKFISKSKDKSKEMETIEMLNYKESHPNVGAENNPNSMEGAKQYSDEMARKKLPNSGNSVLTSLKMSDLRENSAIDEKMKDRKDESGLTSASTDSKVVETKKSVKGNEEKEGVKLKDSKLADDSEKKEKEASLQDAKEAVIAKGLKENPKSSEEKEKGVKLSDSAKLEDNLEKISSKAKDNDPSKITKEEIGIPRYAEKVNSDVINPKGLSQINNRASFVSSDYKDNLDAMKNAVVDEEEKSADETELPFQEDLRRSREKLRKLYSERVPDPKYGLYNGRDSNSQMFREAFKVKDYVPTFFDQGSNDYFKKRESWKDPGGQGLKFRSPQPTDRQLTAAEQAEQQFVQQQQQQQQQQIAPDQQTGQHQVELTVDPRYKTTYGFNFPSSELENTEYHKNYIKSLKRYKGMTEEQKVIIPEPSGPGSEKNSYSETNKKKLQDTVKRRSMLTEETLGGKESALSKHQKLRRNAYKSDSQTNQKCAVEPKTALSLTKTEKEDAKLSDVKKPEAEQDSSRTRRKSPLKLEYEIKVINQSPQDSKNAELSHSTSRRFEKDLKTKLATEDKYSKKYPYSQVSREDLMRLGESESEKKIKRKAPIWKRHDQKSVIQTRAVPSGYYGNRVKFGQKNYLRNNDKANSEATFFDSSQVSSSYLSGNDVPSMVDKSKNQRSWEVRQQDYKHDPMKRYDDSGSKGNSLFLIKKGERTGLPFEEGSPQSIAEAHPNPDNLAKILSNEKDYIILKRKDNKKADSNGYSYSNKFISEEDQQRNLKSNAKQMLTKSKGLHARSFHPEKEDKKSSTFHTSKSNLKKTFDKFRDLAGFFKDNEQENADNQYSGQELKEGRDIVFSEDKPPDPIVISNDGNGKGQGYSQKPQNSIYSISTNFKTLDQQQAKKTDLSSSSEPEKNLFSAEVKSDSTDTVWEPALKNIFPEAKTINSMSKNGNEIIILDLNRNRLKPVYSSGEKVSSKPQQQTGTFGLGSQMPTNNPASMQPDKKFQLLLSPTPTKLGPNVKLPQKGPFSSKADSPVNGAYTLVRAGDSLGQFSFRDLSEIPNLIKALTENKPAPNSKLITKRSSSNPENQVPDNYNKFLRDLSELSEMNKASYRKGKITNKRNENEIALPSSSFPELSTYTHANIKYLGNLLQTLMTGDNPEFKSISALPVEGTNDDNPKFVEESQKMNSQLMEPPDNVHDLQFQSQVSKASFPLDENKESDFLREEGGDQNYQVLFEGFETASDKINRLRREDALKRKLKRTIDDSATFRQKHEFDKSNASPDSKTEDKCSKMSSDAIDPSEEDKASVGEARDDFKAELKSDDETKGDSEADKSYMKSDYESHLNEFFENLSTNKNQKHQLIIPSENTWRRKKRKENHRRKRSASVDVKNKVSTTAVQNTILKNLAEDNYQSVYSPGIKRRLFSTSNGADDADNNSDAYERDKNVITEEAQPKCVKNSLNKCIDPLIVELFGAVDKEEEKNRARRSLTSGFHSNFKREIDLDESMPNDFQNFLVTSLGGFGSQKREVIKKDVALWEGKESSQDNPNQIVESSSGSKDAHEDSTLEKREVSSSESRKTQTYFPSNSDSGMGDVLATMNHGEKKIRSEDKTKMKSKVGFAEEKLPTQIRIQITNASSKEKKSSKPIMDESETTSTEMENLPKEKEFFDKNKINALRMHNVPKLHGLTKSKFSYSDYEEPDGGESSGSPQNTYRPYRRRRKKKKYVPENPIKPIKDFIKFDQKTMETFLKRIMTDQNVAADQTTQKSPVSNHLPQVETVYNPTQGTNKAQLETTRFGKLNSVSGKNPASVKNPGDSMAYDEAIIRSYFKDKTEKIKSDKAKEFEDIDWKPGSGKMRLRQDLGWEPPNALNLPKTAMAESPTYSLITDPPSYASPFSQHIYGQKNPPPSSNYFFHPSSTNSDNANNLYDALKMKQEMKSQSALSNERGSSKMLKKPFYYSDVGVFSKNEDKEKTQNTAFPVASPSDGSWNYDFSLPKKASPQVFKGRDFYASGIKNQNHLDPKNKVPHGSGRKYVKNLEEEKPSILESSQSSSGQDNSKDSDYLDGADDEYLDDDAGKEFQTEEVLTSTPLRKANQLFETPLYHRIYNYKNSDVDDTASEDDEEADEDYEETSEDDDLDDYSLLANTKGMEPELTRSSHDKLNSQSAFQTNSALSPFNCLYPKDNLLELKGHSFEQTEFTNPKTDVKFNQRRQQIPLSGIKVGSMGGTSGLLKKANENANIFEKNLMKGAYGYNFDDNLGQERLPENKVKELNALLHHDRLMKRKLDLQGKLKRSREYPQIGSRLFYAAKTEVNDDESAPSGVPPNHKQKSRSSRHTYYRRNPLNAEFADPDNGFENDSEENGKHFNENLINFGKNFRDEGKTEDEDVWDLEDVAENLEDDGETISEDNVLENVIGKYIMRKRVASPADLNKASEISMIKENTQSEGNHKLNKRSLGKHAHNDKTPEIKIVKRLSSGHLTENNFRKYHKKNLSRKRDIKEFDLDECGSPFVGKNMLRKTRKRENPTQTKRSALDLFKKITNKDRDSKKAENVDGRTAGFEPLSSLNDKKYESSIRDAKFDFLNQIKKISNEGQQSPIKSNVVEFKSHFPYENQIPLDQRKREKAKATAKEIPVKAGQGPWRIELNDQYKWDQFSNGFSKLKDLEEIPAKQDSGNLKAFLVFSNNVRSPKRSTAEDLPATSGSSQKEVGNSYRRKSGRGIYKMHVRKRSLDSSLVAMKISDEDAAQTSRGHFTSEQITESHIDIAEKNRALHDSKSLSEGDSIPQLPRVLQRNTKKSRSFVNADEQCVTGRFPSTGRLTNRKSVFPPSNDANILRDSRQVNEETSKYLGHQIVDSIMSHVSANPKFKELIAPGLAARTSAYKEGIDVKKRPVPQADVSEQLQYFLQKFMTDLEKLAEKHVKKRMCSQIDQQSKDFLQSLLNLPSNINHGKSEFGANGNCPNTEVFLPDNFSELENVEETETAAPVTESSSKAKSQKPSNEIENLKQKHCLLKKLIDDYERLSKLEKESLGTNYEALLDEFDKTNKDLETLNSTPNTKLCTEAFENTVKQNGNLTESGESDTLPSSVNNPPSNWNGGESNGVCCPQPPSDGRPVEIELKQQPVLPVIYFDEEDNKQATLTPPSIFESVDAYNITKRPEKKQQLESPKMAGNIKNEKMLPKPGLPEDDFETLFLSSPIPQTFDLLPSQNSTETAAKQGTDLPPQTSERVRIKQSVSGVDTVENSENPNNPTELHKLSLGDAAGLQLSLKYRGPWVSNLDVAKSMRNIPGVPKANPIGSRSIANIKERAVDAPSLEDVKNPKSFIASVNGYRTFSNPLKRKTDGGENVFPYLNFGVLIPKKRPFESVSEEVGPVITERIPLSFYLRKVSSNGKKRVFLRSNNLGHSLTEKDKDQRSSHYFKNAHRRNKVSAQYLSPPEIKEKKRTKFESEKSSESDDNKNAELEYLVWSTMPAVRRQLNNLEAGFEFDELFMKNPKRKKLWKGGEGKLV